MAFTIHISDNVISGIRMTHLVWVSVAGGVQVSAFDVPGFQLQPGPPVDKLMMMSVR